MTVIVFNINIFLSGSGPFVINGKLCKNVNMCMTSTHTHKHLMRGSSVQEFGVPFMETSAKSGLNVELAFTAVAK